MEIEKWTRLPYLSEGTTKREFFVLDDAVFVLKKKNNNNNNKKEEEDGEIIQPNFDLLNYDDNKTSLLNFLLFGLF